MPILKLSDYGQHIVFIGATGSGKTVLATEMMKHYERYFAIDTQDALEIDGKMVRSPEKIQWYLKLYDRIRYVPKPEYLHGSYFNYIFKKILESSSKKRKSPRVVYIDEIYHIGYGAGFPAWLPKAITTARQRGISFWISSQRPRNIPMPVLSEASKIYVFYLNKEDDIKYISGFARKNKKELEAMLFNQEDDFSFIEIDARKGLWQKLPKLKID